MPSLKELQTRRKSIQATKKITSAMKLIAAAKLKRAQEKAQAARPYVAMLSEMLEELMMSPIPLSEAPLLLKGTGKNEVHLLIAATSNRGLCGSFNSSLIRQVHKVIRYHEENKRNIKFICIGRKGYEQLKMKYSSSIIEVFEAFDKPVFSYALKISAYIQEILANKEFDTCSIVYNKFISALNQQVTEQPLIPYTSNLNLRKEGSPKKYPPSYSYEPSEKKILNELLPQNLNIQIFQALLENSASEQGARMTAMDGATRNAEQMIQELNLKYNRTRQAFITKELIEIISGAEAL
jgi:F-type H+-transporting ATPase subunit gamma